jgi:hypothetical protein
MIVTIIGKTDVVLSLNETGIQIQGKQAAQNVDIDTPDKEREIQALMDSGLIEVVSRNEVVDEDNTGEIENTEENIENQSEDGSKDNSGEDTDEPLEDKDTKPKTSKKVPKPEIPETKSEQEKVVEAEAETQKENSRVIISTGDETVETTMTKNAAGEISESEATKASLEAMEKLEKEEDEDNEDNDTDEKPIVNEEDLPPEEQMGRGAVIMEEGAEKKVDMVNSAVPGQEEARDRDSFIDRQENKEISEAEKKTEDSKKAKKTTKKAESEESKIKSEDKNEDSVEDIFAPDDIDEIDDDAFIEW